MMLKPKTPHDNAMIDALLDRTDPSALERLRRASEGTPGAAVRLAEWARIVNPSAHQVQQARQASERVARGVNERLNAMTARGPLGSLASPSRPGSRRYPAWTLPVAACLALGLVGVLGWLVAIDRSEPGRPAPVATIALTEPVIAPAAIEAVQARIDQDVRVAVEQASRGDTLRVPAGRIEGPMRIEKSLRLVGVVRLSPPEHL